MSKISNFIKEYEELVVERNLNGVKVCLLEEFLKIHGMTDKYDDWLNMRGEYAINAKSKAAT